MKLTMLGTGHATVTKCYNTCFALTEGGTALSGWMQEGETEFWED